MQSITDRTVTVCSLLGSAHVDLALKCLGSLQRQAQESVQFQLHDDGSLTPADVERLTAALGGPQFVMRKEADQRMQPLLATYPALTRIRRTNPYLLKLLDIVLLSDQDTIAFTDTDVYFLRPCSGLFELPAPEATTCMMLDDQNAYSIRSWQIPQYRIWIPRYCNSGLILQRKASFDLDRLEWFFSQPALLKNQYFFVEQTAWALLGGPHCWTYDNTQICLTPELGPLPQGQVAMHFTRPTRHRLDAAIAEAQGQASEPTTIRFVPGVRLTAVELFKEEAARRLNRHWRSLTQRFGV